MYLYHNNFKQLGILVGNNSKVLVQGFTGNEASRHAQQMIEYGTQVVGGVSPNKGGTMHLNKPVFHDVLQAKQETDANVSIIFVPAPFAKDAILESIYAEIELIVTITEGIPVRDMVEVMHVLQASKSKMIGPNCPGILTVDEAKIGIMPGYIFKKGKAGIVSKSGTLTYEAVDQITKVGVGQTTAIGVGGDSVIGLSILDCVKLFLQDDETEIITIIGEIGGSMEIQAARWIKDHATKPILGFIAGKTAPKGKRMGHAGAIVGGAEDTAEAKIKIMKECGIHMIDSPAMIGDEVKRILG